MNILYECVKCGNQIEKEESDKIPECCNEKMSEKLPHCTSAPHAEMARNTDKDEACDDDRGN